MKITSFSIEDNKLRITRQYKSHTYDFATMTLFSQDRLWWILRNQCKLSSMFTVKGKVVLDFMTLAYDRQLSMNWERK